MIKENSYGKFETLEEKDFIYSGKCLELFNKPSLTFLRTNLKNDYSKIVISNASIKSFTSGKTLNKKAIVKGILKTEAIVLSKKGDLLGFVKLSNNIIITLTHLGNYLN